MKTIQSIIIVALICVSYTSVFAKKVKFAVDMTGVPVNTTGMHIVGDFQVIAGFPGQDWDPSTTSLTREGTSNIYSIVVNLPAFAKYEYKFVNGDQSYDAEFVPDESRVGYDFNDNRWLWVDSLSNDTTFVGSILYAGNAPAGLELLRFKVNMLEQPFVHEKGVHVAGNFQGWSPTATMLYSFGNKVYEIIAYVQAGTYEYKFYNGNSAGASESVPSSCATNGNRRLTIANHTVLEAVCFSECAPCVTAGVSEVLISGGVSLYPNPCQEFVLLERNDARPLQSVRIYNLTGTTVRSYDNIREQNLRINTSNLSSGLYFVEIQRGGGLRSTVQFTKE